jgi:hypothetical protein
MLKSIAQLWPDLQVFIQSLNLPLNQALLFPLIAS